MADDLRRFLHDKPIRARRANVLQRLRKLARRHRTTVWAAAVCLLVTLLVLAGGAGWVLSDRSARQRETEQAVNAALEESASWQRQRRLPEALLAARRADGLGARRHGG